jgi:NhaP-type Na+/H+ or K+/H+ antiporter
MYDIVKMQQFVFRHMLRSALIFISVAVVLFTIVGQGMSLPWLVRRLKNK